MLRTGAGVPFAATVGPFAVQSGTETMRTLRNLAVALACLFACSRASAAPRPGGPDQGEAADGQTPAPNPQARVPVANNVVLVHGLYADGSCWLDVIRLLQSAGLKVTAVQNPLSSLADDTAAIRRILALQDGPTVLVGHSFAGTLISETGMDPIVSALVYVAARAPTSFPSMTQSLRR
jgi:pimeloyl-ACP methyl ester carboxylesterase